MAFYRYLSALRQLPQCTATTSKQPQFLSTYVRSASPQFPRRHMLHNFPFVPDGNTSEPSKSEKQTLWQTLHHLLDVLRGWRYQTCVPRKHGRILVSHNTAKGKACETLRSEPSLHGVPGCRIDTKSKKNVYTCTSGHQKRHLTVLACLLYEQQNNNFIFTCTNKLEYQNQHLLPKKGSLCINRMYELIEILRYNQIGVPHMCDITQKIVHLCH